MMRWFKRRRSSVTGRFVTEAEVRDDPAATTTERVPRTRVTRYPPLGETVPNQDGADAAPYETGEPAGEG